MPATEAPSRTGLRFRRTPLGAEPSLARVVSAVAGAGRGFVLAGRWGLPEGAAPGARVVLAGAAPAFALAPGEAPFAALDAVGPVDGEDLPAGAVGGGYVGWLGFDLARRVERTLGPQPRRDTPMPVTQLAWFDDVLRRDEHGKWWVEALLATDAPDAAIDAAAECWRARLNEAPEQPPAGRLGPMRHGAGAEAHRAAVAETIERISAGELFQANVCLRLDGDLEGDLAGLVEAVLTATDPWYGGWISDGDGHAILSASPELFLRRRGRAVTTAPIKGTLPRSGGATDPAADPVAAQLLGSHKDRAEHVMIVDLMRNDLGRVCDYGSIRPDAEPVAEPHAGVWHLVSRVRGRLHEGFGDGRLIRATFPPGSVTGAPKVQAQRVIAAVEDAGREVYTGAHGLLSPACGLDLAVTIRTLEVSGRRAWVGVGGGIVADSEPQAELDEARAKAAALLAAAGSRLALDEEDDGEVARSAPARWLPSATPRPDPSEGLLETIAVRGGRPQRLQAHLARLERSAAALGIELPAGVSRTIDAALDAGAPEGRLRIELLADGTLRATVVAFSVAPAGGIRLAPVVVPGGLGEHKWRDRRLVDDVTHTLGATPLLIDRTGDVLEAGWANLWWEDDDEILRTPVADGRLLPGVLRAALLTETADRCAEAPAPQLASLAARPLLLSSARGFTPARLFGTSEQAVARAQALATELEARLALS